MNFLRKLLDYKNICIQCHNNPDADTIASAYGVHLYLQSKGVKSSIVYGGALPIKKSNMKTLIRECDVPVQRLDQVDMSQFDLLLLVDCQKGQGNVEAVEKEPVMIIDHHVRVVEENENYLIKSNYQSCSTLMYELLLEEAFPVKDHPGLVIALLYGLYTDTSCFADLFGKQDMQMREALFKDQPLFEQLAKSNMSVAELMVASDAMYNHYFDIDRGFAIVEALKCEQAVLGIIGDMVIQVDAVKMTFSYTEAGAGYQISLRSCSEDLQVDKIAEFVCEGIGGGGGHKKKAGGRIVKSMMNEKYGDIPVFEVVNRRLCEYIDAM